MAKQTFTTGQVLTAAQMTSLQQTAMLGGAASAKTANFTLVAADAGTAISMSNAGATTITVNTGLFATGDTVQITNLGAGVCTITAGTATVDTAASLALAQYESGALNFISASAAIFIKGAGAAAGSGGMTLISETVASANSAIDFTGISQSFKQLFLIWDGIFHSNASSGFSIRLNSNSASVYENYGFRWENTTPTGMGGSDSITGGGSAFPYGFGIDTQGNRPASGSLLIDNYASTTKFKSYRGAWQFTESFVAARSVSPLLGNFADTTAITSINIFRTAGTATMTNITNTCIRLYGVS